MDVTEFALAVRVGTPSISISGDASSTSGGGLEAWVELLGLDESLGSSSTAVFEVRCIGESVVGCGGGGGVAESLLLGDGGGVATSLLLLLLASSLLSICGRKKQVNNDAE